MRGSASLIRKLLAGASEPSPADSFGWTPLHVAAHKGNEAALSELLNAVTGTEWMTSVRHSPKLVIAHS